VGAAGAAGAAFRRGMMAMGINNNNYCYKDGGMEEGLGGG
jgi:hypothetical protein